jgi:multiple sugar transport system substrate-binding protein
MIKKYKGLSLLTKINRVLLILVSIIFIFSSISCSKQQVKKTAVKDEKPVLKIYLKAADPIISYAITKYNLDHIGVSKIEDTVIPNDEEFQKKMSIELMAGEGPDIIRVDTNLFKSIHKVATTGIFCDLNDVISKSKDFNIADYNEKVLNSAVFDGKRYLIPLGYDVPVFFTTKERLKMSGIELNESNWTWNSLADTVKTFIEKNKNQKKYFFFELSFLELMQSSGLSFVDYSKKTSKFSSKEFIELLNIYKDIYPSIEPENQKANPSAGGSFTDVYNDLHIPEIDSYDPGVLNNKDTIMFSGLGMGEPEWLRATNAGVWNTLNEEMTVYPYPTFDGTNSSYIKTPDLIGVNSKCKYKNEALDFIKLLLSRDLEFGNFGVNHSTLTQINIKAYKEMQKRELDEHFSSHPLPKSLAEKMDKIIGGIGDIVLQDESINKIIGDEVPKFLNGKETGDQAAKAIDEKVNLYLNE